MTRTEYFGLSLRFAAKEPEIRRAYALIPSELTGAFYCFNRLTNPVISLQYLALFFIHPAIADGMECVRFCREMDSDNNSVTQTTFYARKLTICSNQNNRDWGSDRRQVAVGIKTKPLVVSSELRARKI